MEFLGRPNIGPAQAIAERILQLQQQGSASIGRGIESATESIVGGVERGRAREQAAKDKATEKSEKLITVDQNLSDTLKGIGLDVPVGSQFDKDIFKTAITAKGSQIRTEQTIGARAGESEKDREFKLAQEKRKLEEEAKAKKELEQKRLDENMADADVAISTIDKLLPRVGPFTAGLGSYLSSIPGTEATGVAEDLKTIQALVGFEKLQKLRESSKTGGALGNVSDRDIQLLTSVAGSLSNVQDDKQLKERLLQVRERFAKVRGIFERIKKEGPNAQLTKQERKENRIDELKRAGKSEDQIIDTLINEGY